MAVNWTHGYFLSKKFFQKYKRILLKILQIIDRV